MTTSHCGALLGLAIGDALGTTNEFEELTAPPFPKVAVGPLTDIVGGGPFGLKAGQVTDDTHMACCLYSSISSLGVFNVNDVAARYVKWSEVTFDIGAQTSSALALVAKGESPLEAGRIVWLKSGKKAAANGSLMRTAPIGALFAGAEPERRIASLDDSAITHFDPRCRLACAALNAAIAAAVLSGSEVKAMWQAAGDEIAAAADLIAGQDETEELDAAVAALTTDLHMATQDDPVPMDLSSNCTSIKDSCVLRSGSRSGSCFTDRHSVTRCWTRRTAAGTPTPTRPSSER